MTSRIIARITGAPWLIQAEALETMIDIAAREIPDEATLAAWKNDPARHALSTRPGDQLGNAPTARVRDGVAVIPIAGPIFRYANMMTNYSGATSLSDLAANLAVARADSRVRSILLEIDSPGGEVTGLAEAAQLIASIAAVKPLVAFVEGSAQSAAYWLASAASEIVVSSTGAVGSLGTVVAMQDSKEAQAKSGVRRYEFVSSQTPNKRFDPTTDAGAARLQAFTDRLAQEFLDAAAANRGMSVDQLLAASEGGGTLVGRDAVAAGLADRVDGFEATLARLAAGEGQLRTPTPAPIATTGPAPRATSQEPSMDPMPTAPAPAPENATAEAPAAAPDSTAQGALAPVQTSFGLAAELNLVAAERARCTAIQAAALPGFARLAALAVEGGWPVEQFTQAQAASAEAVESARIEGAGAAFRDSLPAPIAGGGGEAPQPQAGPDKWKADFAASTDLQKEFGNEGNYVAYRQAEAEGKVHPLRRPA